MKRLVKIALISTLTLLPVALAGIYGYLRQRHDPDTGQGATPSEYIEIDWHLLRDLDYETGAKSPELAKMDGKYVKIPGFVVPLEDEEQGPTEFLLVPSPQACIHVPPPPPNQMVMVRMHTGAAPKRAWGPVWVKGRLHIATSESQYGKIAFMLHGDGAEPYRMPDEPAPQPPAGGASPPRG